MSTLAEIEAAASALTTEEMKRLEDFLRARREQAEQAELQVLYRHIGYVPLPKRPGQPVTREAVRQLLEEDMEDLLDLRAAVERNDGKPGTQWGQVKAELDLD